MGAHSSAAYLVQLSDDRWVPVDDLAQLIEMVRDGRVVGQTLVRRPGASRGRPARDLAALAGPLGLDPWAAWEDMDDLDSAPPPEPDPFAGRHPELEDVDDEPTDVGPIVVSSDDLQDVGPLPQAQLTPIRDDDPPPVATVSPVAPTVPDLTPLIEPLPDPPLVSPAAARPTPPSARAPSARAPSAPMPPRGGRVIAFPTPAPLPRMQGPLAVDARPARRQGSAPRWDPWEPAPRELVAPTRPVVRWWRVGALVGAAVALLLLLRWYVVTTASQLMPRAVTTQAPAAPAAAGPVQGASLGDDAGDVAASDAAVYDAIEDQVRARMRPEPLDISGPGAFQDALLIELSQQRVDVVSVEAPVVSWVGVHKDLPETVEVRVRFRSRQGEIDRELAAIGLVVGRYVRSYHLDIPRFEVIIEGVNGSTRRLSVDPEMARRFYLKRISMLGFLRTVLSGD